MVTRPSREWCTCPRILVESSSINIALEPLLPTVQIATNLASGKVMLDSRPAQPLRGGQFTVQDIPFGKHRLNISGPRGKRRSLSKHSQAGYRYLGPVDATDVDAILFTSMGRIGKLECNCANEKVSVSGKLVGEMRPSGLELRDLKEGPNDLKIGEGATRRDFILDIGPAPSLNAFINSNRNVGTLVIQTNVESASVFINNRPYGSTGNGLLRIPLDVNEYSVRVEKNGFETVAAQRVQIRKGGEEKLTFKLVPGDSLLRIYEGAPEMQCRLTADPLGQSRQMGTFRLK